MEEVAFPRGGGRSRLDAASAALGGVSSTPSASAETTRTSSKRKQSQPPADGEFLFGTRPNDKSEGKKRRKSKVVSNADASSHSSSMLPLGGGAVLQPAAVGDEKHQAKPAFIEALSFQKLGKGTRLLGLVRDVTPDYAVVSLSNMLTGFVRRGTKDTDPPLTDVLTQNAMMAFTVAKTTSETVASSSEKKVGGKPETRRRIELTASPSVVNADLRLSDLSEGGAVRGRIVSCEDHGCIVDLSVAGLGRKMAFLRYENIKGGYVVRAASSSEDREDMDEDEDGSSDDEDSNGENHSDSDESNGEDGDENMNATENGDSSNDEKEGLDENEAVNFALNPGRIYDFTVRSIPSSLLSSSSSSAGAIVQLGLAPASARCRNVTSVLSPSTKWSGAGTHTVRTLQPGMLLKCHVEHHAKNGLCVTFLGNVFRGAIDMVNLAGYWSGKGKMDGVRDPNVWWKDVFVGKLKSITARLIAVDPATKIIRLSLLPHVLDLCPPSTTSGDATGVLLPPVGSIIENAYVIRHDPGVGALIALPNHDGSQEMDVDATKSKSGPAGSDQLRSNKTYQCASAVRCAYLHISKAIDTPSADGSKSRQSKTPEGLFAKNFALNTKIPQLRILSTSNLMDNVASCATAGSIVASAVLSFRDIVPGNVYKNVPIVKSMASGGILVELGHGICGLVPALHLFDKSQSTSFRNRVRAEKFRVGNKTDVRCLTVNEEGRRCILSAKKTLIQSNVEDAITEYASIHAGQISAGFVTRVEKMGLIVTFFNNVFGRVSARNLAEELGVEDPESNYEVGDVVKAKVESCREKSNGRYMLNLSLNTSIPASGPDGDDSEKMKIMLEPGSILPAKCMKIVQLVNSRLRNDGSSYIPGHVIVAIKSKNLSLSGDQVDASKAHSIDCKLPFDQILDKYDPEVAASVESLDKMARRVLQVGKKINQSAIVIFGGGGSKSSMPVVSLRPMIIKTAMEPSSKVSLPSPETSLYMGAIVQGYCARLDPRYGAFVRFLNGLTGLVPKLKGGLDIGLYDTILCKISALDITSGPRPKILLKRISSVESGNNNGARKEILIAPGDIVGDVKIDDINFARATVTLLQQKYEGVRVRARIHFTMAERKRKDIPMPLNEPTDDDDNGKDKISKYHPFYKLAVGDVLSHVTCVGVEKRDGTQFVELTNIAKKKSKDEKDDSPKPRFVDDLSFFQIGSAVSAIITRVCSQNRGVWIHICPGISGFIPGIELSTDVNVLNDLRKFFKVGGTVKCCILKKTETNLRKDGNHSEREHLVYASILLGQDKVKVMTNKPTRGDLVVGRINRNLKEENAPALMIELRGGHEGRCDICELDEMDEWVNMPLGRNASNDPIATPLKERGVQGAIVTDESNDDGSDDDVSLSDDEGGLSSDYPHGRYVKCRVLAGIKSTRMVEVSLRGSRLDGDIEDDDVPETKDMVHAYVANTTKKGCFVRLSRTVEGRVILKELSDGFLPDPATMFPPGRLVIGKVKTVHILGKDSKKANKKFAAKATVDLDMRESTLLEDEDKIAFGDVRNGNKYKGTVVRVENYGVFVRLDNSDITGLAHISQCSDHYIKKINNLYDPGDLVKVFVISVDEEKKRCGLSLKASHFEGDTDSDEDEDVSSTSSDDSSAADGKQDLSNTIMNDAEDSNADSIDSDDENFASKLADKIPNEEKDSSSDHIEDDSSSNVEDSEDSSDEEEEGNKITSAMDTDIGFDWGDRPIAPEKNLAEPSDDESDSDTYSVESEDDEEGKAGSSSHKSRKKAAARRREEKEISKRESALADGTADDNPETSADFERLLASDPNSSENWIKYMAYHLSLADINSARNVANRAFDRIEFRREGEKLNVWTALLTLEFKYGTQKSQQETIDRASQQNNPKQVYLRICEMLDREVDATKTSSDTNQTSEAAVARADEAFQKMCKKFKSKKTVWIAHLKYLLKNLRHKEAHALLKRSLKSLPDYKHVETMSKFAQAEFEHGSVERARTIFDTLVQKHPKRLDLLFVYVDKEVKHGEIQAARNLFKSIVDPDEYRRKCSDKQMKSIFKKWFRVEEEHGNEDSREAVKAAAREYVQRTTSNS